MKVLLSIKPKYVEKIFAGTKKFEFRRSLFKKKNVKSVIIYASAPIKKVVGEFDIEDIITGEVNIVWERTYEYAGISRSLFDSYFKNKKNANAISIGKVTKYEKTKSLLDFNIHCAPQSFIYIKENQTS